MAYGRAVSAPRRWALGAVCGVIAGKSDAAVFVRSEIRRGGVVRASGADLWRRARRLLVLRQREEESDTNNCPMIKVKLTNVARASRSAALVGNARKCTFA